MRENVIINGDAVEEMNKLDPESVSLIFADPPYWMRVGGKLTRVEGTAFDGCSDEWDQFDALEDYEQFTRRWLGACRRVLKSDGSIWVIGGMQCIYTIGAIMQEMGFWLINDVIWQKKNPTPNFKGTRLNNSHETLIWAARSRDAGYTFNYKTAKELNTDTVSEQEHENGIRKQMGSVWKFAVCTGSERLKDDAGEKLHSTQKPLKLLERIIAISSSWGDIVLDPFGGTMTTAAAAKKLGRKYIMIERDRGYCEYGRKRLEEIEVEDNGIARADRDRKPPRVPVKRMIEAGDLTAGENFFFGKGDVTAVLQKDGKLMYNGEILDMHSCAARAKGGKADRINGFEHWYVERDGSRVSLAQIREDFRKRMADADE